MRFTTYLGAGLCIAAFAGLSGTVSAQNYSGGQQSYQQYAGGQRHAMFTPQERMMWRDEHRSELKSISRDQRSAYRQQLRQQLKSISPADAARLRGELQARWNALSPQRQQSLEQRVAMREQRRQNGQSAVGYGPRAATSHQQ